VDAPATAHAPAPADASATAHAPVAADAPAAGPPAASDPPAANTLAAAAAAGSRPGAEPRSADGILSGKYSPLVAALFAAAVLCLPIAHSGIWDPFELNVADLSRRLAINMLGASQLVVEGGENSMPRLGDLGRNELPFDSIAAGFKLFGLHEWSGRLPLALWGLAGVLALYAFLARTVDRRGAAYGAAILATMPLYFLQARTMLGDIVTMAAICIAFSGFGIAAFDRPTAGSGRVAWHRPAALAMGLLGLVAGFMCRGVLIGVAIPALGIGLAWGVTSASLGRRSELFGDIAGALAFVIGTAACAIGIPALFRATTSEYSTWVGAQIATQSKFPTFDLVIHYLGHALFPWSAFIPFAVGRLFREPAVAVATSDEAAAQARESHARLALLVGAAVAFGVYSLMAPRVGYLAFGAPALLAAIAAISIRDFERGAPASRAVGVGVAVLMALFLRDYNMFPEKGLSAFAVSNPTFPDSFKDRASDLILGSTAAYVLVFFFAWFEKQNAPSFRREDYLAWPRAIVRSWEGNLLLGLAALELGLVVAAAAVFLGLHVFHWKQVGQMGLQSRIAFLNAFWFLPIVVLFVVWIVMAVRDTFRLFFEKTGVSRGFAATAAGVLVGTLLSFVYYPALAAQLSPKEVFESYARLHHGDEPLALLGVGGRSATYYSGSEVKMLGDVQSAFSWLTSSPARRWLALRNEDLGKLNSLFRGRPANVKENLPVLDARSSQIMLVSNVLGGGEKNQNPFENMVSSREPSVGNRVEANLQDQLLSLGWDVRDSDGDRVEYVVPGKKYRFRLYYKVLAPVSGEWETFIHIDGFKRRFNGDHKTLGGKYPFSLWQPGDYIVDDYEFKLEPNFTPGSYNVLYGLFVGDTRMKVKTGKHDDNRIDGGMLRVQ
jgi:4-amino-4-deoxy-L-arabinose transferase-like glycosyltransferase